MRKLSGLSIAICLLMAFLAAASEQVPPPAEPAIGAEPSTRMSVEDLAKLKQNPVSGLRQVLLQAVVSPNLPGSGKTEGVYSLQVVWPFRLNEDYRLITYSILPTVQVPGAPTKATFGLGDTLLNFFVTPTKPGAIIWGIGPGVLLPTRSNPALGSNRMGLGPALVLFYEKKKWSAGVVL